MRVAQLMSQPAITCSADDDLGRAAQLMWEHDCGSLPVVDHDGTVIGVITDRDVCMAAYTTGRPLSAISVRTAMSKDATTCRAEENVETAEQRMSEKRIRRLPVVDESRHPVGVLSISDLARDAIQPRNRNTPAERGLTTTLAAVSEPRNGNKPAVAQRGASAPS